MVRTYNPLKDAGSLIYPSIHSPELVVVEFKTDQSPPFAVSPPLRPSSLSPP